MVAELDTISQTTRFSQIVRIVTFYVIRKPKNSFIFNCITKILQYGLQKNAIAVDEQEHSIFKNCSHEFALQVMDNINLSIEFLAQSVHFLFQICKSFQL